jgi:hypothetical protein
MGADPLLYLGIIQATKTWRKLTSSARWTLTSLKTITEVAGADVDGYLTGVL